MIVGSWIHRPPSIAPFRAIGNAVRVPILSRFPLLLTANFREASCTNSDREAAATIDALHKFCVKSCVGSRMSLVTVCWDECIGRVSHVLSLPSTFNVQVRNSVATFDCVPVVHKIHAWGAANMPSTCIPYGDKIGWSGPSGDDEERPSCKVTL